MIKPIVILALILGATPLVAFADPMSIGGDGNLLAANTVAATGSGGSASISDPADSIDDDAVREPLATPEPTASHATRQQPRAMPRTRKPIPRAGSRCCRA
jgi:hypothetical protein